jgi:hypothetical protein
MKKTRACSWLKIFRSECMIYFQSSDIIIRDMMESDAAARIADYKQATFHNHLLIEKTEKTYDYAI